MAHDYNPRIYQAKEGQSGLHNKTVSQNEQLGAGEVAQWLRAPCSYRRAGFGSQHQHSDLQLSTNSVPGDTFF